MNCTERKIAGYMIIITIILILECIYPGLARGLIQIICMFSWIALVTGFVIEFNIWKEQEAIKIRKRCRHRCNRTGGRPVMGQNRNGQIRGQPQRPTIANRPPRAVGNRDISESSHNSAEISLNNNRVNREMHSNTTQTESSPNRGISQIQRRRLVNLQMRRLRQIRQNIPNVVEDIYISSDNENGNASTANQTENRNASVRYQQGRLDQNTNASSDVNHCTAENNTGRQTVCNLCYDWMVEGPNGPLSICQFCCAAQGDILQSFTRITKGTDNSEEYFCCCEMCKRNRIDKCKTQKCVKCTASRFH